MKPRPASGSSAKFLLALAACVGLVTASVHAQVTYSGGFDYTTGKYGESQSTQIYYVPFSGTLEGSNWQLKATVPYIRVSGPGNVIRDVGPVGGPIRVNKTTESGLGDIIGSAAYDFYRDQSSGLTLTATGKVKFGTASRSRGLGTGETDVMMQLDAYIPLGELTPFGTLGYRVLGDPPGSDLRNGFYGTLGATYRVEPGTSIGAALDLREKTTSGGDAAAELTGFVSHDFSLDWKLQGYAVVGFTDASPDFGFGGVLSYSF